MASTETVSKHPGVTEILARLETLRSAVEDFAAREEKLNQDFRARSNAELNAFESRTRDLDSRQADYSAAAELALAEEINRLESQYQRRKAAISRAQLEAKRRFEQELTDRETRLNDRVREQATLAEKQRDHDLAEASTRAQNFQSQLTGAEAALGTLAKTMSGAFRGGGKFRRLLAADRRWPEPDFSPPAKQLFEQFQQLESQTRTELKQFEKNLVPRIFSYLPIWLVSVLLLGVATVGLLGSRFGIQAISVTTGIASLAALVIIWIIYWFGLRAAAPAAGQLAGKLARARRLLDGCFEKAGLQQEAEQARLRQEFESATRARNQEWKASTKELASLRLTRPGKLDEKARRLAQKERGVPRRRTCRVQTKTHRQRRALPAGDQRTGPAVHLRTPAENRRTGTTASVPMAGPGHGLEEHH